MRSADSMRGGRRAPAGSEEALEARQRAQEVEEAVEERS